MLTEMCWHIVAVPSHLTGPMWFREDVGVILLWEPKLAPGWPSQLCFCPLSRPPCPCGDLGGFPPWPWFSVLDEGEQCLACVWGLEEWEGGLEQRRGRGLPSCVVTEIWGSERPVEGKEMKIDKDRQSKQHQQWILCLQNQHEFGLVTHSFKNLCSINVLDLDKTSNETLNVLFDLLNYWTIHWLKRQDSIDAIIETD